MRPSTILVSGSVAVVVLVPLSVGGPASSRETEPTGSPVARSRAVAVSPSGDAEDDVPGTRFRIRPEDLPAPVHEGDPEAPDFENPPTLVEPPRGLRPDVPEGFTVRMVARGLNQPRVLRTAPNGDVFVAESGSGRVLVLAAGSARRLPARPEVFAEGLDRPFGIAFFPPDRPRYVYVGAADQVVRFPYRVGDRTANGPAEVIIPNIPTERHWTRDLAVAPDGKRLFVSVGSASNVAGDLPELTPAEIRAFEATHGRGAAWGDEENRAVVRVFDPEGTTVRTYATGLRNCSGMTVQPGTGDLWCTGNERDHLGADVPPDFLTTVRDGGFYGWPWYYTGGNEDPAHAGERPDLRNEVIVPDVLIQAHSSTMQVVFYDRKAFPRQYRGDAFATLRGSWNREQRTGYKVIRVIMENGRPTGEYENFMTGFALDEERVWGRPTGIVVARDGALLVSDDANGTIFRVAPKGHDPGRGRR
jgi:glucose/arabinose dehydrogenase